MSFSLIYAGYRYSNFYIQMRAILFTSYYLSNLSSFRFSSSKRLRTTYMAIETNQIIFFINQHIDLANLLSSV